MVKGIGGGSAGRLARARSLRRDPLQQLAGHDAMAGCRRVAPIDVELASIFGAAVCHEQRVDVGERYLACLGNLLLTLPIRSSGPIWIAVSFEHSFELHAALLFVDRERGHHRAQPLQVDVRRVLLECVVG